MKGISIAAAAAALVGSASPVVAQGVTTAIAPDATAPAGCSASYDGTFEITVAKVAGAAKRHEPIAKRAECSGDGILVSTLAAGTLLDAQQRTGYIASNFQFQYDAPAQAGAIYTSGFSACANGSLALGGSAVFYECESGDFYNLYDRSWAPQCAPVEIILLPCGGGGGGGGGEAAATQVPDGQIVGTQVVTTTMVSALSDGQPQVKTATTGVPLCEVSQIADGQVQVGTTPCASITSTAAATATTPTAAATTPATTPSLAPVSQFSDGQIQVTPAASVPTVASSAPVTTTTTPPGAAAPTGSTAASTLATSAASGSSTTSSAAASGTSAPATAGAAEAAGVSSIAARLVGLVGAVALLLL